MKFPKFKVVLGILFFILFSFPIFLQADMGAPGQSQAFFNDVPVNSMMAGSPLSNYTLRVMVYSLIGGVLLLTLFVGAFLIVSYGLLSDRRRKIPGLPAEEVKHTALVIHLDDRRARTSHSKSLLERDMRADGFSKAG